mgnify:CR=1 FL=1
MAIVPLLFSQLSSLLLIAIIGYAAVKKGIMKASECKPISTLLIYVIIPSSIIKALQLPLSEEKVYGFGIAVIFAIAVHLFWLVLTTFLGKATSLMVRRGLLDVHQFRKPHLSPGGLRFW